MTTPRLLLDRLSPTAWGYLGIALHVLGIAVLLFAQRYAR